MNIPYQKSERAYRDRDALRSGEQKFQVILEESDLWITLSRQFPEEQARDAALRATRRIRGEILAWSTALPEFRHSLSPLATPLPEHAPQVVRRMDAASRLMGVGPFAAVAGATAQNVAEELATLLKTKGVPEDVLVENGGDTYLCSTRERVVGLLPDPASGKRIGLLFHPDAFPLALCASSGKIGPSLSFGQGDLAVACARDGALADAAATAYGNMLKSAADVPRVLERARRDARFGLAGVFAQCCGQIGIWGQLELTAVGS